MPRLTPHFRWIWLYLLAAFACSDAVARDKLDIVQVRNGDRITCEIISLEAGRLQAKTSSFGTVHFDWTDVVSIESPHPFFLELVTGERRIGTIHPAPAAGRLQLVDIQGTSLLALTDIARIGQQEASFSGRLRGSASIGFEHAQATDTTVFRLGIEAEYRNGPKITEFGLDLNATSSGDGDTKDSARLGAFRQWLRPNAWFTFGLGAAERNESQGVEARLMLGGGLGRYLHRSVDAEVIAFGGAAGVGESLAGPDDGSQPRVEGIAGLRWQIFRFGDIETVLNTRLLLFPSFSGSGRFRGRFDTSLRRELVKDLFLEFGLYNSYESDPSGADAERNDYGLSTSLGYKF